MACDLSNLAIAKLLQGEKITKSLGLLQKRLDGIMLQASRETDQVRRMQLLDIAKKVEASLNATALGGLLQSIRGKNINIATDVINSLKQAWKEGGIYSIQALNVVEGLLDTNVAKGFDDYFDLLAKVDSEGTVITSKELNDAMIEKIKSDKYYETVFNNFFENAVDENSTLYKEIEALLPEAVAKNKDKTKEYYLTYTQLFNPRNELDIESILKRLTIDASESGDKFIDPKTIVKNIETATTLEQLEDIAKYNLTILRDNQEVINVFTDRLIALKSAKKDAVKTLKGGYDEKAQLVVDMYYNSKNILSEIMSGKILREDYGFATRKKIYGIGYVKDISKLKRDLRALIRNKETTELEVPTLDGKTRKLTKKDSGEILMILGPMEIIRLSQHTSIDSITKANTIIKAMGKLDDFQKETLQQILKVGDESKLGNFMKEILGGEKYNPKNGGEIMLQMVTDNKADISRPGVYFNPIDEMFSGDVEAANVLKEENNMFNKNALNTGIEVSYTETLEGLETLINKGVVKNIYLPTNSVVSGNSRLVDIVNAYNVGKDVANKVNVVLVADGKKSTFSVGKYTSDDGKTYLTVRGRDEVFKNEILSKIYFVDQPIEQVFDGFDDAVEAVVVNKPRPKDFDAFAKNIENKFGTKVNIDQQLFEDNVGDAGKQYINEGGVVYGFTKDGQVYINPSVIKSDTLMHEASHLWFDIAKEKNPKLIGKWRNLIDSMSTEEAGKFMDEFNSRYGDVAVGSELYYDEMLALLSEKAYKDINKGDTFMQKVKTFLQEMYKELLSLVKNKAFVDISISDLENITIDDFVKLVGRDILDKNVSLNNVQLDLDEITEIEIKKGIVPKTIQKKLDADAIREMKNNQYVDSDLSLLSDGRINILLSDPNLNPDSNFAKKLYNEYQSRLLIREQNKDDYQMIYNRFKLEVERLENIEKLKKGEKELLYNKNYADDKDALIEYYGQYLMDRINTDEMNKLYDEIANSSRTLTIKEIDKEIKALGRPRFSKGPIKNAGLRDGQAKVGDISYPEVLARERFDIKELNKIGEGSDRVVFELGEDKVVKIAKTNRGLYQNAGADFYLASEGVIPNVYEIGNNYVVMQKAKGWKDWNDAEKKIASQLINDSKQFRYKGPREYINGSEELMNFLEKYEWEALSDYDMDSFGRGDISKRNLGFIDGKIVIIDEGTINLVRILKETRDNKVSKEFEDMVRQSKQLKKQFGDTDGFTRFSKGTEVPEELKPLYEEAKKYKSADDMINGLEKDGKVLYHGTNANFSEFSLSRAGSTDAGFLGEGIYLTPRKGIAKQYGKNLMKTYPDIKNPLIIDDVYMFGGVNPDTIRQKLGLNLRTTAKDVRMELIKQGYDGVYVNELLGGGKKKLIEVVVLKPDKIKTESQLRKIREKANASIAQTQPSLEGVTVKDGMLSGVKIIEFPGPAGATKGQASFKIGEDGLPKIDVINAPIKDGEVVRGERVYEKTLAWFQREGYDKFTTTYQTKSGREAIQNLIDKGLITEDNGIYTIVKKQTGTRFSKSQTDEKILSLNHMFKKEIDFKEAFEQVQKEDYVNLINKAKSYYMQKGYDISNINATGLNEIEFREAYHNMFNYGVKGDVDNIDMIFEGKYLADLNLKKIMGIGGGERLVNHYSVLYLMNSLESQGFKIPTVGARGLLNDFVKTGDVSREFESAFRTLNQEKIEVEKTNVKSLLQGQLELSQKHLQNVGLEGYVPSTPKEGAGMSISSFDARNVLSIQERLFNAKPFKGSIDKEGILERFDTMQKAYIKKKKDALNVGASKKEIDLIDEEFYQQLDEFEYFELMPTIGRLYTGSERNAAVYGRKFNMLKTYTKESEKVFDDSMAFMKQDLENRLTISEDVIVKGSASDSMEKLGYSIKRDVDGKPSVVTVDEAIKLEETKIPENNLSSSVKIQPEQLDELDTTAKIEYYKALKQQNKENLVLDGYIRHISESTSFKLRDYKFFDNYKVQFTGYGPLPESINTVVTPGVPFNDGMRIKSSMFEAVANRIKKTKAKELTNYQNNLQFISDTAADLARKEINLLRDTGKPLETLTEQADFDALVNDFTNELIGDFEIYAHLKPVRKADVERVQQLYGLQEGVTKNERDDYLKTTSDDIDEDTLRIDNYEELEDETALFHSKKASEYNLKRIEREAEGMESMSEEYLKYLGVFNKFIARDISRQNAQTNKIYMASDAVSNSAAIASQSLKGLYGNSIFDRLRLIDTQKASQAWFGSNTKERMARRSLSDKFIKEIQVIQNELPSLMDMTDADFALAYNTKKSEKGIGGIAAADLARYYRDLRKALGTDGMGAGPTSSRQVNIAIHNMHLSVNSITKTSGKESSQALEVLNNIVGYQSHISTRSVLAGLLDENVAKIAGEDLAKLNITTESFQKLLNEERLIKTQSDFDLEEGTRQFNNLFRNGFTGSKKEFTTDDYISFQQSFFGTANMTDWNAWLTRVGRVMSSVPGFPFVQKGAQLLWTMFSGAAGLPGYISMMTGLARGVDANEVKEAGNLRHAFGFGEEIYDLGELFRGGVKTDGIENYANKIIDGKDNFLKQLRDINAYNAIQDGTPSVAGSITLKNLKNLIGGGQTQFVEYIKTGRLGRTLGFVGANGNQIYDFAFLGTIKDYAFYNAIRYNTYRNFETIAEFKNFVNTADEALVEKVIANIKATAERIVGDVSGNNFSSANKAVNPYAKGALKHGTDAWFGFQDTMSYLNGRGRARSIGLYRTIGQTAKMLYKDGGIFSAAARKNAIAFIQNTPEYKMFMNVILSDVLNGIRIAKVTNDGEDDEVTFDDFYRGLKMSSQAFQALSIVGENRPFIAVFEAAINQQEGATPYEAFLSSFKRTIFSNLKLEGRTLEMYKDFTAIARKGDWESIGLLANKYLFDASAASLDFMFGKEDLGGRLVVQGYTDYALKLMGDDTTDEATRIKYETAAIMSARNTEVGYENGSIKVPFSNLSRFLNNALGIGEVIKSKAEDITTLGDLEDFNNKFYESIKGTETLEQVKKDGYITINLNDDVTKVISDFEYMFRNSNPFAGDPQYLIGTDGLIDKWKGDRLTKHEWNDGIDYLFGHMGKEKVNEFGSRRRNISYILSNAKQSGEEGGPTKEDMQIILNTFGVTPTQAKKLSAARIKELVRLGINSELLGVMKEFEGNGQYELLGRLYDGGKVRDIAEDALGTFGKLGDATNDKKMQVYNDIMPIISQMYPLQNERFVTSTLGRRHANEINEKLGWNVLVKDEDNDYYKMNYKASNGVKQIMELQDGFREGNMGKVLASFNELSAPLIATTDKQKVNALYSLTRMYEMIKLSNLPEAEKAYVTHLSLKNNAGLMKEQYLEQLGPDGKELVDTFYRSMYQAEDDMSLLSLGGVLDELKKKYGLDEGEEGGGKAGKGGGKGSAAKKPSFSKAEFQKFKTEFSNNLDAKRDYYKTTPPKVIKLPESASLYENSKKSRYPMNVSAITKTATGLTKKQLTEKKDIKRQLKAPKRPKLQPPLI